MLNSSTQELNWCVFHKKAWGLAESRRWREPCRWGIDRRWCQCSTNQPFYRSDVTWWPIGDELVLKRIQIFFFLQRRQYLRCHVQRWPTQCGRHNAVLQKSGKTKIGYFQSDVFVGGDRFVHREIEQNVLWLQVAVHNVVAVNYVYCSRLTRNIHLCNQQCKF